MLKHTIHCLLLILPCLSNAQQWEPTSSPPNFLTDHSFGFSIDGKGYLVAGTQEFVGHSNKFWQYDPTSDAWTELDTFPGPGRGYAIGDVWDGKAYMGFGTSATAILNDLWVFDPDSMKWTQLESCPCDPRLHPAMVALNGKIFVGLGNGANGNTKDWWEYDIATDAWEQKPDFPNSHRHHPYQFALGNYVYTGFGHGAAIYKDWYRYDPELEIWEQMADIPDEGRVAGTQFSHNGKGYVLSGDGEDHLSMEEGEFWEYDPLLNTWTQLPSHPGKSRWAPSSFIIDDILYLFNGTSYFPGSGSIYQEEAFKFNLKSRAIYPNIEKVVSHRYNSEIYDMESMPRGQWALAVKDMRYPGDVFEGEVSIVTLDSLGNVENRFVAGNGIFQMGPLWLLPNNEFVVRLGFAYCDPFIYDYNLAKFDSTGNQKWQQNFYDWDSPASLELAPDSNILYQSGNQLTKISNETGEILWEHTIALSPSSILFVPGTEDIIVGDTSGLKYYTQIIVGDEVSYQLTDSVDMNLNDEYMILLGSNDDGVFFGASSSGQEIFMFEKDLAPTFIMLMPNGQNPAWTKFSFTNSKMAIGVFSTGHNVLIYDFQGNLDDTYENELPGVGVNNFELSEEGLAVSGIYQSGLTADDYPPYLYYAGRQQAWFRFNSNTIDEDPPVLLSLAITDVEMLEVPTIDSFFSPIPMPDTLYYINGGRFRIYVTNTGEEPVRSFAVNTIFNTRINVNVCGPASGNYYDFATEPIAPGESIWVEVEGLLAQDQMINPPQFCFWTSAPNELPDGFPSDDLYCLENTVDNKEIFNSNFSIHPNPASFEITLMMELNPANHLSWYLIDVYGRELKSGVLERDDLQHTIDVSDIASGFYFIKTDAGIAPMVIQR